MLLSFHELQSNFIARERGRAPIDYREVVVSDTPENFDGVEKGFGLNEREKRGLTQGTRRGRSGVHREEEEQPKSTARNGCATRKRKRARQAPPLQRRSGEFFRLR
jgi:hypothetical protein